MKLVMYKYKWRLFHQIEKFHDKWIQDEDDITATLQ